MRDLVSTHLTPENTENIQRLLKAEQIRLLAQYASRSYIGILAPIALIAYIVWPFVPFLHLCVWLLLVLTALFGRRQFARKILPHICAENAEKLLNNYVYWAAFNGLAIGLSTLLFLHQLPLAAEVALCMIVVFMVTAGAITASSHAPTFYAYAIAANSQLLISWLLLGRTEFFWLAILIPPFTIIQMMQARENVRMLRETFFTRFENQSLIESLDTERQIASQARDRAESANQAKSQFLAAASHDLRQPLHALSLYIAVLKARTKNTASSAPEIASVVANIETSLGNASTLLDTLLDISRLDAGAVKTDIKEFLLQTVFEHLWSDFQLRAEQKKLQLHIEYCDATVISDRVLLEQILHNLVDNALKYTLKGRVHVYARRVSTMVHITVEDSGIGIPVNAQQHIFEEFYQLGNAERDREKGLGLGLAIVRRTADLLGIKLSVHSKLGEGSRFQLLVQASETPAQPLTAQPIEVDETYDVLRHRRIIFIDDEATVRHAMQGLLQTWDTNTRCFGSLEEAVIHLKHESWRPELIVSDFRLRANATGLEAISGLRQQYGPLPALLITGDTSPERIAMAQSQGVTVLFKPVQPEELHDNLRKLLLKH